MQTPPQTPPRGLIGSFSHTTFHASLNIPQTPLRRLIGSLSHTPSHAPLRSPAADRQKDTRAQGWRPEMHTKKLEPSQNSCAENARQLACKNARTIRFLFMSQAVRCQLACVFRTRIFRPPRFFNVRSREKWRVKMFASWRVKMPARWLVGASP